MTISRSRRRDDRPVARRFALVVAAAAFVSAASLVGTAASEVARNTGSTVTSATTITILSYHARDPYKRVDDYVASTISRAFPDVQLRFVYTNPSVVTQRIKTGVAAGNPPDLAAYFPGPSFVQLARAGVLLDLSAVIRGDSELRTIARDWREHVPTDQYVYDGKVYGITTTLAPFSVWYWRDVFAKAKINQPPRTINQLIAVAKKLRANGIEPMSLGLASDSLYNADYVFNQLVANFDPPSGISNARRADKGRLSYRHPAFSRALTLFKRIHTEGVFNDSVLQDSYDPTAKDLWKDKKVAIFGGDSGPWMAHYTSNAAARDIGITHFPTVSGKPIAESGLDQGFIAFSASSRQKTPEHRAVVAAIVKAYLSRPAQERYYRAGVFPVSTRVVKPGGSPGVWGRILDDQIKLLNNSSRVVDYATYTPEIYEALTNGVQSLLLGDQSVADVVASLDSAQRKAYPCAPRCK
jgi:raffinose/stachyose/melibiose transport system substrate-binding protein